MKVKLDENVPSSAARLLIEQGHDAETVRTEGLSGAPDQRLAAVACEEDRLLVTLDRGFADVRAYPPGSHPGIVVLRLPDQRPQRIDGALQRLLAQYDLSALQGCIVIIQPNIIRIRRPQT